MGLDMYLNGRRYMSEFFAKDDAGKIENITGEFPELRDSRVKVKEVRAEVAYWRKANQIHGWFVRNVQDGNDDCGSYSVSREVLQELLELCEEVLETRDSSKLPLTSGFFFGSDEVDDWYYEQLEDTVEMLMAALQLPDRWDFEYHSSW